MEWKVRRCFYNRTLLGNTHGLPLPFAGAGVGAGALAADREATLQANATVAVDGGKALHLSLLLTTKVTLDEDSLVLDHRGNLDQLLLAELTGANVRVHPGVIEDLGGGGGTDTENVRERSLNSLLVGDVCAEESCHDLNCCGNPRNFLPGAARGAVLYQRCSDWQEEFRNFLILFRNP